MKFLPAVLVLISGPAFANDVYFSNLIKQPEIRKNWIKITNGYKFRKEDGWIIRHDGVRGPLTTIAFDGESYFKDEGCQPHDCLDNSIVILVNRNNNQIWMVHRKITFPDRHISYSYLGNPDQPMRVRLKNYLSKI